MTGTWIVAGLIAAVGLAMIAGKTRDAFARQQPRFHEASPYHGSRTDDRLLTETSAPANAAQPVDVPKPPPAAETSPEAAGGAPHRKRYDLGEPMPAPESLR